MMQLVRKKEHSKRCDGPVWFYRAAAGIGVHTQDPREAVSVALGLRPSGITDLYALDEYIVVRDTRTTVAAVHAAGKRCMIVVDVSRHPTVAVFVDKRDQIEVFSDGPLDGFATDVIHHWQTYDVAHQVLAMTVNVPASFTGLKLLPTGM